MDRPSTNHYSASSAAKTFASDEPLEIGSDNGSRVTGDYTVHHFSGDVNWVEIEIPSGAPDDDVKISSEQRLKVAFARE